MKLNQLITKEDFSELFNCLNEELFRYVYVRCGYNKERAQDITQEIFIKAWQKRSSFNKQKSSLKNWIYIIARNHIIDIYRKDRREINLDEKDWENAISEVENFDQQVLFEETLEAMEQLSITDKELLVLRYVQELEIEDITKIIKKNYIATKVAIHRALNKIKKIINAGKKDN